MRLSILAILFLFFLVAFTGRLFAQTDDPCQAERDAVKAAQDYLKELQDDYDVGGAGSHYVNPDIQQAQRDLSNASRDLAECLKEHGQDS
jgi:hypothetical protein